MSRRIWSPTEVVALPAVIDIVTAGSVLGVGRTKAHHLVRAGEFPVPVLQLGNAYRVPTQPLKALLGLTSDPRNSEAGPASPAVALAPPAATAKEEQVQDATAPSRQ